MTQVRAAYYFDRVDRRTKQFTPGLLTAVRDRIVEFIYPHKIILFGSRAGDHPRPDSDLDLLITIPFDHPLAELSKRERCLQVLDLFRFRSFGLDVIVVTDKEIETLLQANEGEWNLILDILKGGKVLYEHG